MIGCRTAGDWHSRCLAVAVVGTAFAIAVGLRVDAQRHHPITERYGTVATVVVTPSREPRALGGNRMMFRGSLRLLDGHETTGRVVVFASAAPSRSCAQADRSASGPASAGQRGAT